MDPAARLRSRPCGYASLTSEPSLAAHDPPEREGRGPEIAGGLVALVAAGFALAVLAGAAPGDAALVCAGLLLATAAAAVAGWDRTRARAVHTGLVAARAREEQRGDRERLERHTRRLEAEREQQSQLLRRLQKSWKAEREWSRELRGQLQRMQTVPQTEHGHDDVRELILHAAIELVDAEKGLLVARADEDVDGDLDVVFHEGFEHDPTHSAVAQRFARAVLARDEILRDDDPPAPGETEATAADREIETLVAIPLYLRDRFHGVIVCANRPGGFQEVDDAMLLALGDHAGAALQHGRLEHELGDARRATVRVLAEVVAARDPIMHRETGELAIHAGLLAEYLELDLDERDVLIAATLLRAIGQVPLPERPALRPGPLTPDERSLIELHPRIGFTILMQAPALHATARAVLHHHERFDGTGYPAGLAGYDIPLASRVLGVLEAFGAMTHERPYRDPLSPEQACEALLEAAGTQFDPAVVQPFVEQVRRAPQIAREDVSAAILEALPYDFGESVAVAVDGATLLGNHHRLQEDIAAASRHDVAVGVLVLELADLPRVNAENGHRAGDRLIEHAATTARRAAARLGGTAYRVSGRRLGILIRARGGNLAPGLTDQVRAEFLDGPRIRVAMAVQVDGESPEAMVSRAREALREDGPQRL